MVKGISPEATWTGRERYLSKNLKPIAHYFIPLNEDVQKMPFYLPLSRSFEEHLAWFSLLCLIVTFLLDGYLYSFFLLVFNQFQSFRNEGMIAQNVRKVVTCYESLNIDQIYMCIVGGPWVSETLSSRPPLFKHNYSCCWMILPECNIKAYGK